jgi:hypothetical protein
MDTDTSKLAFNTAINEIKNGCPGITSIFILDENKQVLSQDENATKEVVDCTANSLAVLKKTASIAGEVEAFTCVGSNRKINFTRCENNYCVTVSSKETDERTLTMLARVMVPSMLKLAHEVIASRKEASAETPTGNLESSPASESPPAVEASSTKTVTAVSTSIPTQTRPKIPILTLPASEFTVENLSGINIIYSDPETVYVDRALLGEWKELFGDKPIEEAMVESPETSKKYSCRFQPIRSQKLEGKNVILVPDRIQRKLEIKRGAIVLIRPIVEEGEK